MNDKNTELAARHLGDDEYKVKKLTGPNSSLRITGCIDPVEGNERYSIKYKDRENKETLRKSGSITLTENDEGLGVGNDSIKLENCIGKEAIISVAITGAQ